MNYTLTINNPIQNIKDYWNEEEMQYLVGQHEIAPTTGTPHI